MLKVVFVRIKLKNITGWCLIKWELTIKSDEAI